MVLGRLIGGGTASKVLNGLFLGLGFTAGYFLATWAAGKLQPMIGGFQGNVIPMDYTQNANYFDSQYSMGPLDEARFSG